MLQPSPVSCNFFLDFYSHVTERCEGQVLFLFLLSGPYSAGIDGSHFEDKKPAVFVLPSHQPLKFKGNGQACLLSCAHNHLGSLLYSKSGSSFASLLPSAREGIFRTFHLSEHTVSRLESILRVVAEETGLRRSDYLDMVQFQLFEILLLLRREGALSSTEVNAWESKEKTWSIDDVMQFIRNNYDSTFSLDELASRCQLNSSYFSRVFREKAGIPLFEYINRLRIERAVQLLRNSSLSILEIAMTVGYNNVSFFNRYFRKLKGCSPGEMRKRMQK